MSQLAFNLAERGAALAADKADRMHHDWTQTALDAFRIYAYDHSDFTTEDVIAASTTVPQPPEKRAWGHVALLAKRRGFVIKKGFSTAKSAHAHCRPVSLWSSMLYAGAAAA